MINNFDLLEQWMENDERKNIFYHLQVVRRGKDHPNLPAANQLLKSYVITSINHLERYKEEIIKLCEDFKCRAYLNIAPKDLRKLNELIIANIANNLSNGNVRNPMRAINDVCGQLIPITKMWVVDIDKEDLEHLFTITQTISEIYGKRHGERDWLYFKVNTNSGIHLITKPFNRAEFKKFYSKIDIHTNNPTLLYFPKSLALC